MGFLAKAFAPSAEKSGNILDLIRQSMGGSMSASGKAVNVKTALQVSTVFACCRVIGEGVAQVPLKLMQETTDGSRRRRAPAKDHPLYKLLAYRPNDWQTSFEYREMIIWHAVLTGNHYSYINRGVRGEVLELIPFEPGQVTPKRADDYTITYQVRGKDGTTQTFRADEIWHVRGPSWDGWQGLEAVKIARNAIGLALAIEESTGSLHKNGVRTSGAYALEGTLKSGQHKELSDWIHENHAGSDNAGKPLILDRSAKWIQNQMSGIDAQSYETRRLQIEEICRYARVWPIMIGHADKTMTFASSEQLFIAHVVHTLAPWYQRLEQSIDANLLTDNDRKNGLYANFVEEGLLRGSAKDTKDTLLGYVNGGLMTQNEGRDKLDLDPDTDPESDKLHRPANIAGNVSQSQSGENP
jgi:HK97 family phage portal protein